MLLGLLGLGLVRAGARGGGGVLSVVVGGHDIVDLLQSIGKTIFRGELVLLQCQDELVTVFEGIVVQLCKGCKTVELCGVHLKQKFSLLLSVLIVLTPLLRF